MTRRQGGTTPGSAQRRDMARQHRARGRCRARLYVATVLGVAQRQYMAMREDDAELRASRRRDVAGRFGTARSKAGRQDCASLSMALGHCPTLRTRARRRGETVFSRTPLGTGMPRCEAQLHDATRRDEMELSFARHSRMTKCNSAELNMATMQRGTKYHMTIRPC
jgi:hypothetical protein